MMSGLGLIGLRKKIIGLKTFWIAFGEVNKLLRYARNDRHCEERSDEAIQEAI